MRFRLLIGSCGLSVATVVPGRDPSDTAGFRFITAADANFEMTQLMDQGLDPASDLPSLDVSLWLRSAERIDPHLLPFEADTDVSTPGKDPRLHRLFFILRYLSTSVMSFVNHPELVVVYRQYCPSSGGQIDNSVRDFWFLNHVQPLDVGPKVYLISRPMSGSTILEDLGVSRPPQNAKLVLNKCPNRAYSHVRYLVMDKVVGSTLHALTLKSPGGKVPVHVAAQLGVALVRVLRKLHDQNVVHGDIHSHNVIVDGLVVKLIDFELAKIYDRDLVNAESKPSCGQSSRSFANTLDISQVNTFWESQHCSKSFRDDMYRALVTVSAMMHGPLYDRYFKDLSTPDYNARRTAERRSMWVRHRSNGEIFNIAHRMDDSIETAEFLIKSLNLAENSGPSVKEKFDRLSAHVVSLGIHDLPDYTLVEALLQAIAIESSSVL